MQLRRPTLLALFLAAVSLRADAVISYRVTVPPVGNDLSVEITANTNGQPVTSFQIPTWSPGAYIIGDYARNIAQVTAADETNSPLKIEHPDRLTWAVTTGGARTVSFSYRVQGSDVVQQDGQPKRAHISGPRTYMYIVGRKEEASELFLRVPEHWKVAVSLDPQRNPVDHLNARRLKDGQDLLAGSPPITEWAMYRFSAPGYDVLADAPVEMGDFAEDDFVARRVPHRIVLYGDYSKVDREKLKDYCRRAAESQIDFFNDAPFKRYVFLFRCSPNGQGGGGLEHLGSTEISLMGPTSDRHRFVIAHEYFHAWNVKRIRPAVLGPFDYTQPVRTKNLWWSEGVTSYFSDLLSRRVGLNTDEEYLKHLGDTIGQLQTNPARLKVTADDSSYRVWDGGGSQGFGQLSYYTKGELMGLCLDLKIRAVTNGRHSLDDVMRSLYIQCGKGKGPGFGEEAIKETVNKVAGQDLSSFYDRLARTTEELPFDECLGYAGLRAAPSEKPVLEPDLGMTAFPGSDRKGLSVRRLTAGGPAETAGLRQGDVITAVNGKLVSEGATLSGLAPGAQLTLSVTREGQALEVPYTVGTIERRPWVITVTSSTPESVRFRERWLNGK